MMTEVKTKQRAHKKQSAKNDNQLYDTFIIGAGISGIAAAIKLNEAGLNHFKIIEKANTVGDLAGKYLSGLWL